MQILFQSKIGIWINFNWNSNFCGEFVGDWKFGGLAREIWNVKNVLKSSLGKRKRGLRTQIISGSFPFQVAST